MSVHVLHIPSTSLMTYVAARVAGVEEIVLCTPPPVNPQNTCCLGIEGANRTYLMGEALVTDSRRLAEAVGEKVAQQFENAPRKGNHGEIPVTLHGQPVYMIR